MTHLVTGFVSPEILQHLKNLQVILHMASVIEISTDNLDRLDTWIVSWLKSHQHIFGEKSIPFVFHQFRHFCLYAIRWGLPSFVGNIYPLEGMNCIVIRGVLGSNDTGMNAVFKVLLKKIWKHLVSSLAFKICKNLHQMCSALVRNLMECKQPLLLWKMNQFISPRGSLIVVGNQWIPFGGNSIRTVKSTSKTLGSFILFKDATNPGIFFGSVDAIIYDTDKTTVEIHLKNVSNQIADEFAIEMLYSKKIAILHDQIIELACGWTNGSKIYASRSYGLRYLYG